MRILVQKKQLLFVGDDLSVESHEIDAETEWLFGSAQCAAIEWLAVALSCVQASSGNGRRLGAAERMDWTADRAARLDRLKNDPRLTVAIELLRRFPDDGYEYVGEPAYVRKMSRGESEAIAFLDFGGHGCGWSITDLIWELRKA